MKFSKIGLRAIRPPELYDRRFAGIAPSGRPVLPPVASQSPGPNHISIPVRTGRTRRKRHVQANSVFSHWPESCDHFCRVLLSRRHESLQSLWVSTLRRRILYAADGDVPKRGPQPDGLLHRNHSNGLHKWYHHHRGRSRCHHGPTNHGLVTCLYFDRHGSHPIAADLLIVGQQDFDGHSHQTALRTIGHVLRAVFHSWTISRAAESRPYRTRLL